MSAFKATSSATRTPRTAKAHPKRTPLGAINPNHTTTASVATASISPVQCADFATADGTGATNPAEQQCSSGPAGEAESASPDWLKDAAEGIGLDPSEPTGAAPQTAAGPASDATPIWLKRAKDRQATEQKEVAEVNGKRANVQAKKQATEEKAAKARERAAKDAQERRAKQQEAQRELEAQKAAAAAEQKARMEEARKKVRAAKEGGGGPSKGPPPRPGAAGAAGAADAGPKQRPATRAGAAAGAGAQERPAAAAKPGGQYARQAGRGHAGVRPGGPGAPRPANKAGARQAYGPSAKPRQAARRGSAPPPGAKAGKKAPPPMPPTLAQRVNAALNRVHERLQCGDREGALAEVRRGRELAIADPRLAMAGLTEARWAPLEETIETMPEAAVQVLRHASQTAVAYSPFSALGIPKLAAARTLNTVNKRDMLKRYRKLALALHPDKCEHEYAIQAMQVWPGLHYHQCPVRFHCPTSRSPHRCPTGAPRLTLVPRPQFLLLMVRLVHRCPLPCMHVLRARQALNKAFAIVMPD